MGRVDWVEAGDGRRGEKEERWTLNKGLEVGMKGECG